MFLKFSPSSYIFRFRKGKLISEGKGLSFFCLMRNTSAMAVRVTGTDADFIFEENTNDFQTVTIQGQLSYKISDYKKISELLDFTVDLKTKTYNDSPEEKLSKRMINIAAVLIKDKIGSKDLRDALVCSKELADSAVSELRNNEEISGLGVTVTGFSILKISANPETNRALEAGTRESILKDSDDALYERRNASIEQERKIKENELSTEISVEEKKKKIKETEIQTKRLVLEKNNELKNIETENEIACSRKKTEAAIELDRIKIQNELEKEKIQIDAAIELEKKKEELAALKLANAKKEADAEAYRISAVMEAYGKLNADVLIALAALDMEPEKMIAQAFEKLAANSQKIGNLNITPDLLESLSKKEY